MSQLEESLISARLGELIADARFAREALDAARSLPDQRGRRMPGCTGCGRCCCSRPAIHDRRAEWPAPRPSSRRPIAAFAHWTRGVVLLRANILPGAQRAAERAVALDPEESDTHVLLARVYLQKSQWESARAAVADAASHGADDEELMPLRAAIAAGRGLDVRAGDTWRAFAQRYPANALARTGHAWTLLESGDITSARTEFEQARELDPTNAWALEGLEVTRTRLRPVHRRMASALYGKVMVRRDETMMIAGSVLVIVGLLSLASGRVGVVLPLLVTLGGAVLPILDAWRREA